MTALALLASTFALVFFLGLQSLVVNGGHRIAAACNSLAIGLSQLTLYKLAPDASGIEIVGYLAGGPIGIVCAITVFSNWRRRHG